MFVRVHSVCWYITLPFSAQQKCSKVEPQMLNSVIGFPKSCNHKRLYSNTVGANNSLQSSWGYLDYIHVHLHSGTNKCSMTAKGHYVTLHAPNLEHNSSNGDMKWNSLKWFHSYQSALSIKWA